MFEVFFLFPSPPQKRVKERGAGVARERHTGTTLFINLGWGAYWTKTTSSAESPGLTSRKSSGRSRRSI